MFKTETIYPLIEIVENLKSSNVASISSLINVYGEMEMMLEDNPAFMDTLQLIKSKLMGLIGKITTLQTGMIFVELGIPNAESLERADKEQIEQLIKRFYEIIFKYKGLEETKEGRMFVKSQEIKKQITEQMIEVILKVYQAACDALKKWDSNLEIYDVETIKRTLH